MNLVTDTIPKADNHGGYCIVTRDDHLRKQASDYLNRDEFDLVLKIFGAPINGKPEDFYWGSPIAPKQWRGSTLLDSTRAQNVHSFFGRAPRVYAICEVIICGERYAAQVCQDATINTPNPHNRALMHWAVAQNVLTANSTLGIFPSIEDINHGDFHFNDINSGNAWGDWWLDWQGFKFTQKYEERLKRLLSVDAAYGPKPYQDVPEFGITDTSRVCSERIASIGLDKIDFSGKTVLDVGCSAGFFCNFAASHGARYVLGIDLPNVVRASREYSNYLGHFNIDYKGLDLSCENPVINSQFDIVFYLSVQRQFGFLEWVLRSCKSLMVFEENIENGMEILKGKFEQIEIIGKSNDHRFRSDGMIAHCHSPILPLCNTHQ